MTDSEHHHHHRWHDTWLGSDRLLARNLARPVARFLTIEAAGGVLLLIGALIAIIWANSPWASSYTELWDTTIGINIGAFSLDMDLRGWINDGAMALFFFVAGMEIKREMVSGELKDPKAAALPIIGAAGGMLVPAVIYIGFNHGGVGSGGWGIPMATDIAFAVGIVSLLGRRVPVQLKLFLLTLAVADDLGAIFVIAIAYSQGLAFAWLLGALAVFGAVLLLRRAHVWYFPVYVVLGMLAWYFMLKSGVHATVAGVVLGFLTPTRPLREGLDAEAIADRLENQDELSAAQVRNAAFQIKEAVPVDVRLVDVLHPWTGYVIIPLFALANAGVPLGREALESATSSPITLGVFFGLVAGKTIGVFAAAVGAAKLGIARLPRGVTVLQMLGIAMGAGIGFTVAIFVTGISLREPVLQDQAKIGIFAASFAAALLSAVTLSLAARRIPTTELDLEVREAAELFESEPTRIGTI